MNSIDIHVIAFLGGSSFSSIVWVSFNSVGFKESTVIFIMVGKLLFPLAILLECFCGQSLKILRILGCGVIGIRVDYGIKEPFLKSLFDELYGSYVVEWESSISGELFKVAYIGVEVFFVFQAPNFSLHILGFVGVGKGLSEVCFEKVLELFIIIAIASVDSGIEV